MSSTLSQGLILRVKPPAQGVVSLISQIRIFHELWCAAFFPLALYPLSCRRALETNSSFRRHFLDHTQLPSRSSDCSGTGRSTRPIEANRGCHNHHHPFLQKRDLNIPSPTGILRLLGKPSPSRLARLKLVDTWTKARLVSDQPPIQDKPDRIPDRQLRKPPRPHPHRAQHCRQKRWPSLEYSASCASLAASRVWRRRGRPGKSNGNVAAPRQRRLIHPQHQRAAGSVRFRGRG